MEVKVDFLVIGSGLAGLYFAARAAAFGKVAIITKKWDSESNTNYAQGGIAAVVSETDSFDSHIQDTLKTGVGLCKKQIVKKIVCLAPRYIQELQDLGVPFTKTADASGKMRLDLWREGGHSKNRVVHAADATGREIEKALLRQIRQQKNIQFYENHLALDLITQHHLRGCQSNKDGKIACWGAYVLDADSGQIKIFRSHITVLATGGVGQVYRYTTNPKIATGDGIAMAYRAGARVANLEFIQFHPTMLYSPKNISFLISETLRGAGGVLRMKSGEEFMQKYHPLKELAPRDEVARAIDSELKKSGDPCVFLDITHLEKNSVRRQFPNIYQQCLKTGIDITKERIPVVPAAHYVCGGILTDESSRTDIQNLYACGEVACSGMHGANRLASNSLLEALALADFASQDAVQRIKALKQKGFPEIPVWSTEGVFDHQEWVVLSHDREEIQNLMWDYVGIVRTNSLLKRAHKRINILIAEIERFYKTNPVTYDLIELRNLAVLSDLIIRSAMLRKESRGLHYNSDHAGRDDKNYLKDTVLRTDKKNEKK